jgi:two-component system, sensor histidine kinase ChiS
MEMRASVLAKCKLWLAWCFMLCLSGIVLEAQNSQSGLPNYRFEALELPAGEEGNRVNEMIQDREGYLWFASHEGLHRYDGYEFKSWYHDPQDSKTLSNSYLECLLEDRRGRLWVGSYRGGLNLFDRNAETFVRYSNTRSASVATR